MALSAKKKKNFLLNFVFLYKKYSVIWWCFWNFTQKETFLSLSVASLWGRRRRGLKKERSKKGLEIFRENFVSAREKAAQGRTDWPFLGPRPIFSVVFFKVSGPWLNNSNNTFKGKANVSRKVIFIDSLENDIRFIILCLQIWGYFSHYISFSTFQRLWQCRLHHLVRRTLTWWGRTATWSWPSPSWAWPSTWGASSSWARRNPAPCFTNYSR